MPVFEIVVHLERIDRQLICWTHEGTRSRTNCHSLSANLCCELWFPCSALCTQDEERFAGHCAPFEMVPPPGHVPPPQLSHNNPEFRVSKYVVTPWTASKIALATFAVGVLVGYQLNTTIRRWAAKLLRRIQKDD